MKIENSTDLISFLKENLRIVHTHDEYDLKIMLKCIDPESKKDIILTETWIALDVVAQFLKN